MAPADPEFLELLARQALETLPDFLPQHLSNFAWALARLADDPAVRPLLGSVMPALAAEAVARLAAPAGAGAGDARAAGGGGGFSRQHLALLLWSLARWAAAAPGGAPPALDRAAVRAIADALRARRGACLPQEISNALWAAARLDYYDPELVADFAAEAAARVEELEAQHVATLAWALERLGHFDAPLLAALAAAAARRLPEFSDLQLAHIAGAYASLDFDAPALFAGLRREAERRAAAAALGARAAAQLLRALGLARALARPFWDAMQAQLAAAPAAVDEVAATWAFQAWLLARAAAPGEAWPVNAALAARGCRRWSDMAADTTTSALQRRVGHALAALGEAASLEHPTEDGLLTIDLALVRERIAIEVDGPSHFTRNTLRPLGSMFARVALLEARGWRVVCVPFFRFNAADEAPGGGGARAYLCSLLAAARAGEERAGLDATCGAGAAGAWRRPGEGAAAAAAGTGEEGEVPPPPPL
jgi:hypothetical protein